MPGIHSVWVYPDPAAGGWSPPLASNPYMNTDGTGWRAIPYGSGFTWANGAMNSTNPAAAYQALGRDPLYPVDRPPGVTQWRIRADVFIPSPARVYLLVRFGRTPNDAFQTPSGPDEATLYTWRDVAAGSHRLEATFAPAVQPDPAFVYLSPQITVDPTTAPIAISSMELAHGGAAGVDLSCLVDSVSIVHGRDDPTAQPEASAATVDLTTDTVVLPPAVDVGAVLAVTTEANGVTSQRFVGRITDVALGWDDAGKDTPDAGVGQILAVGPLADLGRRVVGSAPFPQELDGARVSRVMAAAGVTLDPIYSDPGTVQILARDIDSAPALDVAHDAATSATGTLWQTRAGEIRYADADHRRGTAVSLTLDACNLLVTPTWRRNLDGLVNDVSIGYGTTPEGGEQPRYTEANTTSKTKWGTYGYTTATELAALADAQTMAHLLLARNSSPVWVMAALPVDTAGLTDDAYETLLALDVHALVTLTGLPAIGTAPTNATLWVEGWAETLTWGGHELELVVSGYCRTAPPPRWDDAPPTLMWGGTNRTETRRNLSTSPTAAAGGWFSNSGASWSCTRPVAITGHPQGITTAAEVAVIGGVSAVAASIYNTDNLANASTVRGVGVWVKPPYQADVTLYMTADQAGTQKVTRVPGGAWTYCTSGAPGGGYTVVQAARVGANAVIGDKTYVTGCITEAATVPPDYFDGSTPDTATVDYAWTGGATGSASTMTTLTEIGPAPDPTTTWDDAACLGPTSNYGRWDDQPASLRWDQVAPTVTWDTYGNGP